MEICFFLCGKYSSGGGILLLLSMLYIPLVTNNEKTTAQLFCYKVSSTCCVSCSMFTDHSFVLEDSISGFGLAVQHTSRLFSAQHTHTYEKQICCIHFFISFCKTFLLQIFFCVAVIVVVVHKNNRQKKYISRISITKIQKYLIYITKMDYFCVCVCRHSFIRLKQYGKVLKKIVQKDWWGANDMRRSTTP